MEEKKLVFAPCQRDIRYPIEDEKVWHVGEYYNEGGRRGVVFHLSGPRHGLILSLEEGFEAFALDCDFEDGNPSKTRIGHTLDNSGSTNTFYVSCVDQWREKYPAFTWCERLGKGWFLPSVKEVQKFLLDDSVRNAVNETLKRVWGKPLRGRSRKLCQYWTSTESDSGKTGDTCPKAFAVNLTTGKALPEPKSHKWYVRAIGYF